MHHEFFVVALEVLAGGGAIVGAGAATTYAVKRYMNSHRIHQIQSIYQNLTKTELDSTYHELRQLKSSPFTPSEGVDECINIMSDLEKKL